jgi:hypothetical protein
MFEKWQVFYILFIQECFLSTLDLPPNEGSIQKPTITRSCIQTAGALPLCGLPTVLAD